jgi:hypothetical protein
VKENTRNKPKTLLKKKEDNKSSKIPPKKLTKTP